VITIARLTSTGFGIYLCILGAVFAAGAIGLFAKRLRISAGPRADGRIVGYRRRIQQRRAMKPQYMPLVRFTPRGREPVEFQSRTSADPARWPEGTLVPVAYRPDFPDQAEIATPARLWLAPLALLLFALACVAIAWKAGG
jgi:hypothetical protein